MPHFKQNTEKGCTAQVCIVSFCSAFRGLFSYLAIHCFNCSKQPMACFVEPVQTGARVLYGFFWRIMSNRGALHSHFVHLIELYFSPPLQRVAVLFGKLLDNGLVFSFDFVPRSNRSRYSTKVNTSQVGIAATFPKLPDRSCMRSGSLRPHLLQDN